MMNLRSLSAAWSDARKGVRRMQLRLREVRERKLLRQEDLAERTGITLSTISRLENGLQRPRVTTVKKLAEGLGVPPEELIVWGAEADERETGKAAARSSGPAAFPWDAFTRRSHVG